MNKKEIIEAINSTIVTNGQKGITAESLSLILTEIVNISGEGDSGGGSLRVIVPELMMLGSMISESGELSPSSWAAMRTELEAAMGLDLSEYEAVINASFTHNAAVAQQILAKARAGQGVSIVLDQTPYCPAIINLLFATDPEAAVTISEASFSSAQPAGFMMNYMKPTPEAEAEFGGEMFSCILVPVGGVYTESLGQVNYPSHMTIDLMADGSLFFIPNETDTESGS